MAFDGITVANIVKDLQDTIAGGRISKIVQPEPDELLLTVRTASGQKRLLMSASASLPLIYLTDSNKQGPMTAPAFCMLLRKHIQNGRIVSVTQPMMERALHMEIEHLNELGDTCRKYLIMELMGKHSNIIFCDENYKIIDSIKRISSQTSSVREVLPGRMYFLPNTMGKSDPLHVSYEDFSRALQGKPMGLSKAIYGSFTGISPVVAEEVCHVCGIDSSVPPKELTEDMLRHVYEQFSLYLEPVKSGAFSPCIYYNGDEPVEYCSLRLSHFAGCRRGDFADISSLLETYYASRDIKVRIRQKSANLRRIVQTALERARKKYDLQLKQVNDTAGRDKYRVYGELICAYGYGLKEGAKELPATDYHTGEDVVIPLNPAKSPGENAKDYFEKYNKQKRTFTVLTELIKETADDISYLESVSNALDIAETENDLGEIREELTVAGYLKRKAGRKNAGTSPKPLHYLSSDGYHIYVGKNNIQNEELTLRVAQGSDWWFHVKGCPGSHVIIKAGGTMPPNRTFEEAGRLAAYYSKNRDGKKAEVDYLEKRHIRKPNGARPGFVIYHTNYSMVVEPDIKGIKLVTPVPSPGDNR